MIDQRTAARRAATMVTVVILLPVLFTLSAIAVNLAYIQTVNTKLQIVTDASTRAAGWEYVRTGDETLSLIAAQDVAALNPVEATVMAINPGDVQFGVAERNTKNKAYTFTEQANGNAVRLVTQTFHDGSGDAVHPFFPVFGTDFQIRPLMSAGMAQTTLDVAVVVDKSGSMAYASDEPVTGTPAAAPWGWAWGDPVPPNSRWHDLVESVDAFCYELSQTTKVEKVGLCSYSNYAVRDVDLTDDYSEIAAAMNAISDSFDGGSTAAGDGILCGIDAVTDNQYCRPWATNALVVMSDGDSNRGADPIYAAQQAADEGIPIFTVTFSDGADQSMMRQVADMTGGGHYHASDATELQQVFRDIAARLPSMLTE